MSEKMLKMVWSILKSGQVERVVELDVTDAPGALVKLGRSSSATLCLDDASVSRIHAVVERDRQGQLVLMDLVSPNGTFANGERVERHVLADGDLIQVGEVMIRFELREVEDHDANAVSSLSQVSEPSVIVDALSSSAPEPWALAGYYDEHGNYIPGFYDDRGEYHYGYGYHDEQGQWVVLQGYYDPQGQWVEADLIGAQEPEGPSDRELYTQLYFEQSAGALIEVAMLWGDHVLSVVQYDRKRQAVVVGASTECDFVVEHESLRGDSMPLLVRDGESWSLVWSEGIVGAISTRGQVCSLAQAAAQGMARAAGGRYVMPFGAKCSARVEFGEVTLLVRFADRERVVAGAGRVDLQPVRFFMGSAVAHLAFLMLALTMPENPDAYALDGLDIQDRFVQLNITPEQKEELPVEVDGVESVADESQAHKGLEGKAGDKAAPDENKRMTLDGSNKLELARRQEEDRRVAVSSGALAVLAQSNIGAVLGSADKTLGADTTRTLGNLDGGEAGDSSGVNGLGLTDAGRGGPGDGDKSIGMSDDVVGDSIGRKPRKGGPKADLGGREERVPEAVIAPGELKTTGCLAKESIQRVVRLRRNEIRACYEAELQRGARQSGQVKIAFKINAAGGVFLAKVDSATLQNKTLHECMTRKIRHWQFSPLTGCAMVDVKYPFNFSY